MSPLQKSGSDLPAFRCKWSAERGVEQLADLFSRLQMGPETFNAAPFTRLKQLKLLADTGQIDENFFWTHPFGEQVVAEKAVAQL